MQIKGNLDNFVLDTIIVDILFVLTSQANQDAQNKDLTNQEAQGSHNKGTRILDAELDREYMQLLTLATTNALLSITTLTNG